MWGTREIGYRGRFPKAVVPQIRSILELSLLTILLEWWCFSEEDCTCSLLPATQTSGAAGRSHERSWAESVKELARSIHVELKTTITFMRWFQPTCRFPETSSELLLYLCFQLLQVRKKKINLLAYNARAENTRTVYNACTQAHRTSFRERGNVEL